MSDNSRFGSRTFTIPARGTGHYSGIESHILSTIQQMELLPALKEHLNKIVANNEVKNIKVYSSRVDFKNKRLERLRGGVSNSDAATIADVLGSIKEYLPITKDKDKKFVKFRQFHIGGEEEPKYPHDYVTLSFLEKNYIKRELSRSGD